MKLKKSLIKIGLDSDVVATPAVNVLSAISCGIGDAKADLTIIVPTYNANDFLINNFKEWEKLAKAFNVIIIEDGTSQSKDTAKKMGATYYKKKNGNWGSVINFSKELNLETKYSMIIDADDIANVDSLKSIIKKADSKDILLTAVDDVNYNNGKSKRRVALLKKPSNTFIHTIIFKTSLFKKIGDIPEGIPHQDHHVVFELFELAETFKESNESPYKYFYNIPGQTISKKPKNCGEIYSTYKNLVGTNKTTKYIEAFTTASIIWNTRDKKLRKEMLVKYKKNRRNRYMPYFWVRISSIFKRK